jgi:hypothetical protein
MKKIIVSMLFVNSFISCQVNDTIKDPDYKPKDVGTNLIDQVDLTQISNEQIDYIKSQKEILHSKNIKKPELGIRILMKNLVHKVFFSILVVEYQLIN